MYSKHPIHTYTGCWIICEKVRKNGHQANHLGTPQNNLGTPLGVPTPTLGTPGLGMGIVKILTIRYHFRFCLSIRFLIDSLIDTHWPRGEGEKCPKKCVHLRFIFFYVPCTPYIHLYIMYILHCLHSILKCHLGSSIV